MRNRGEITSRARGEETTREMKGKMMANIPTNITTRALNRLRIVVSNHLNVVPVAQTRSARTCDQRRERDCDRLCT